MKNKELRAELLDNLSVLHCLKYAKVSVPGRANLHAATMFLKVQFSILCNRRSCEFDKLCKPYTCLYERCVFVHIVSIAI